MSNALLLNFREKDSECGVRRETVKELADHYGLPETTIIHMAIARFHRDIFYPDVEYDFPSDEEVRKMDRSNEDLGEVVSKRSILDL
ncbi:MAG TPA: hypothetical protein VFA48_06070 [Gammaproteobacteria bacterium]|nr:hypothetical protein [Gammaproteobacteria bacterium]